MGLVLGLHCVVLLGSLSTVVLVTTHIALWNVLHLNPLQGNVLPCPLRKLSQITIGTKTKAAGTDGSHLRGGSDPAVAMATSSSPLLSRAQMAFS